MFETFQDQTIPPLNIITALLNYIKLTERFPSAVRRRRRRRSYALVFYASSPFREPVLLCNDLEARENFFPIVDTNGYNNG